MNRIALALSLCLIAFSTSAWGQTSDSIYLSGTPWCQDPTRGGIVLVPCAGTPSVSPSQDTVTIQPCVNANTKAIAACPPAPTYFFCRATTTAFQCLRIEDIPFGWVQYNGGTIPNTPGTPLPLSPSSGSGGCRYVSAYVVCNNDAATIPATPKAKP